MGKFRRIISKPVFWGLAAVIGSVFAMPQLAQAQLGGVTYCTDIPDTTTITTAITGQGDEIVTELDADHVSLMAALVSGLTKLDMDLTALGGTNTNNATMHAALLAKATDSQAASANQEGLHAAQAQAQVDAAAGSGAYQRNNLCQQATIQAGRSSAYNGMLTELGAYNGYRASKKAPTLGAPPSYYGGVGNSSSSGSNSGSGPTCTTCGGGVGGIPSPAGVIGAELVSSAISTKITDLAKAATPFFGSLEGGSDSATWNNNPSNQTGVKMVDNDTPVAHLDVDPLTLSFLETTYSDTEQKAHDQMSNYFVGVAPDIVTSAKSFAPTFGSGTPTITPQYASAIVANREKLAFQNLTSEAFAIERAYHDGVESGADSSVGAIYQAANITDPRPVDANGNHLVSGASMDWALYEAPADDPNFASNLAGQNTKTLLEFIADEMMLMNKMEHRRYLQEMEMYKIQSASLNLQARTFNFSQNP